jgi:hypothetical protein
VPRDLIDELLEGRVKATLFGGDRAPRLGRLVILEPLGTGAMGTVFAAYDPRLDRRVAVKVLRATGDADHNQRVLDEARALGRLAHPNVVAVHDADEVDGALYIVMELAPGAPLRAWSAADHPWREIADVMRQAALGLAAIHAAGVVHRDVKPDNLIIGGDRVRVVDFGVAAREHASATGPIAGTPLYMAPEVLAGEAATEASDQFSFGVTLYEALHGDRPHRAMHKAELLAAARGAADAPRPPGSSVPGWLHAIAIRALAADPARRFPSMAALADELSRDRRRRRRLAIASAGVLAALAITGAIAYRGGASAADRDPCAGGAARRRAAVPDARLADVATALGTTAWGAKAAGDLATATTAWETAFRRVCEATRVAGAQPDTLYALRMRCLDRRLDRIAALAGALATPVDAAAREDASAAIAALPPSGACVALTDPGELALPDDPTARARVLAAERDLDRAWSAFVLARYTDARAQINAIDERTGDLAAVSPGLRAAVLLLAGSIESRIGDASAARVRLDAALAAAATAHAADLEAEVWTRLLRGALFAGDPDHVIEWAPFARAAAARAGLAGAEIDGIVGEALRDAGRLAAARDVLVRALASPDALRGERRALLEMNLGSVELASGHPAAADAAFARALALADAALGADHPGLALYVDKRASAARARGALADALAGHDRSLALRTAAFGERDRSVATSYLRRAQTLIELGRLADAVADLARARAIRLEAYPGTTSRLGEIDMVAGDAALAAGNRADATAAYRTALAEDPRLDVAARLARAGEAVELAPLAADDEPTVERVAAASERIARLARTEPARARAEAAALARAMPCADDLAPAFLVELGAAQRAAGARAAAAACFRAAIAGLADPAPSRLGVLANIGLAETADDPAVARDAAARAVAALDSLPELDQFQRKRVAPR